MAELREDENEYIVLNRQEESAVSEKDSQSTENYTQLSQYQYFDFEAIQKNMRLTEAKMRKAKEVLTQNLVTIK